MKEVELAVKEYSQALLSLKEGLAKANDDLGEDGVIKRFEFTFEMFWKTTKLVLESEGINCNSPKSCIKEAFKHGELIDLDDVYITMLEDRNLTSHVYNKTMSRGIFTRIKNLYIQKLIRFEEKLIEYLAKYSIKG